MQYPSLPALIEVFRMDLQSILKAFCGIVDTEGDVLCGSLLTEALTALSKCQSLTLRHVLLAGTTCARFLSLAQVFPRNMGMPPLAAYLSLPRK
jgi:hypothetical protein